MCAVGSKLSADRVVFWESRRFQTILSVCVLCADACEGRTKNWGGMSISKRNNVRIIGRGDTPMLFLHGCGCDNVGHCPHLSAPDAVAAAITAFL